MFKRLVFWVVCRHDARGRKHQPFRFLGSDSQCIEPKRSLRIPRAKKGNQILNSFTNLTWLKSSQTVELLSIFCKYWKGRFTPGAIQMTAKGLLLEATRGTVSSLTLVNSISPSIVVGKASQLFRLFLDRVTAPCFRRSKRLALTLF